MSSLGSGRVVGGDGELLEQSGGWQTVTRNVLANKSNGTIGIPDLSKSPFARTFSGTIGLTSHTAPSDSAETPNDTHTSTVPENNEDEELNSNLMERLDRVHINADPDTETDSFQTRSRDCLGIREYSDRSTLTSSSRSWLAMPELPTPAEIGSFKDGKPTKLEYEVPANKIYGPWKDKEDYLQSHYELLREDAVAPLREAVEEFHAKPYMMEKDSEEHLGIYENVYITGMTFAHQGIAARVQFSLRRAEKRIRWEQSKRLTSGSIVALTTATDKFDSICKVAVVAARPLIGLQQNPPVIDIFFNCTDELEIDPQQEWLMIESRSGYYEAHRHTLRALQKMSIEKFPMAEHIVALDNDIRAPKYVEEHPLNDISSALHNENEKLGVNILDDWPELPEPNLDQSQLTALRRILTKRLAIIQGPPGTGKTHVSVVALKIMLSNMSTVDPPIIVTAQTNHALDQLLRHIASFEPNFIRLGGRTTDQLVVKPRTLFEIRKSSPTAQKGSIGSTKKARSDLAQSMIQLLQPLVDLKEPLTAEFLQSYGLLSQAQVDSLVYHTENWAGVSSNGTHGLLGSWLEEYLVPVVREKFVDNRALEVEEVDLAYEQLKEVEAESGLSDDDGFEVLRGEWLPLGEPFTARGEPNDMKAEKLLKERQDIYNIPATYRGIVYSYLQRRAKDELLRRFRIAAAKYSKVTKDLQNAKWERDYRYLKDARIIGMTTTGLSKYRALVASMKPKVVLIEEAAETLEAHVTASCFESLEHLVLVGDHQQLRGHCAVKELEGPPFNLDVSMFERFVLNNIEYSQLTRQRRMRPEIRKIIQPIYEHLQDHPCVENREDVPGMGKVNSFFHTHTWPESNDNAMSKCNFQEADMVIGFFDYLVHNGVDAKEITVLTFYNGQRKTILQGLKAHHNFQRNYVFKVVTVDSYQGEENEVILLSLVRNNFIGEIGFLNIDNRVCVALSRARKGFYVFGNGSLLSHASPLWRKVLDVMRSDPPRVGQALPITCTNHKQISTIRYPSEWEHNSGGCKASCGGTLPCGHRCKLSCHPYSHAVVRCQQKCSRIQGGCGHPCLELCYVTPCRCKCGKQAYDVPLPVDILKGLESNSSSRLFQDQVNSPFGTSPETSYERAHSVQKASSVQKSTHSPAWLGNRVRNQTPKIRREVLEQTKAWMEYAKGGHEEADKKIQAAHAERLADEERKRKDDEMELALFGSTEAMTDVLQEQKAYQAPEVDVLQKSPAKMVIRKSVWNPPVLSAKKEDLVEVVSLLD